MVCPGRCGPLCPPARYVREGLWLFARDGLCMSGVVGQTGCPSGFKPPHLGEGVPRPSEPCVEILYNRPHVACKFVLPVPCPVVGKLVVNMYNTTTQHNSTSHTTLHHNIDTKRIDKHKCTKPGCAYFVVLFVINVLFILCGSFASPRRHMKANKQQRLSHALLSAQDTRYTPTRRRPTTRPRPRL